MGKKPTKPSAPPRQKPAATRRQQEQFALDLAKREREKRRVVLAALGGVIAIAVIVAFLILRDDGEPGVKTGAAIDGAIPSSGLTIGDPNAPVTLVEYADFQCTACAQMNADGMPSLLQEYVATGKVALTFVPNSILGEESDAAIEAALCANDQGQFWPMHNALFANQDGENNGAFSSDRLQAMAKNIGLDLDQFSNCMDANTHAGEIQNYHATAQQEGISSAPTFVLNNGEPFGWDSWDSLKAEIDLALGG
ncbi:thioredoxin domain-containing protein [soil metagenome]